MLKIIGHHLCPYVQRVVILMLEKNIAYQRIDVDLDNKPEWLLQYSPTAKVPLLITTDDKVLFESQVICEYIDEISAGSLQPLDSFEKARHKAWGEFGTQMLNLIAKIIYQDSDKAAFENSIRRLKQQLNIVEAEHSGGHYFSGSIFHLTDAIYASLFRYFSLLQKIENFQILAQMPKLSVWQQHLSERSSVQAAVPSEYETQLMAFISNKPSYLAQQLSENTA